MNTLDELIKPKFVNVQFDTAKVSTTSIPDSEFDSELEDGDDGLCGREDATTFTPGVAIDSLFVIDSKGADHDNKSMEIDVRKDPKLVRTQLSDLRPSLYISSDAGSAKAKMRDMNHQWADDILLKKSVLSDDAEKSKTVATRRGKRAAKQQRRAEREQTAGQDWFGMVKPEMTAERRRDLELLKMRKVFDGKTFYKKNDIQQLPKYFEVGTVVDNATDFYSDRVPKKQRKQTLVDELLADEKFKKLNKKRYRDALDRQQYTSQKAYIQLKRIKKKEEAIQRKKSQVKE